MKNKSQYRKNPYLAEDLRNELASNNKKIEFLETYTSAYAEIKNINTNSFWNEHFDKELDLKSQDRMTKEKIERIIKLLPRKKIKILDLGFGQGYFEEKLEITRKNQDLSGIDISTTAVIRGRKKFRGNFIQGDIAKIVKYYKKKSFDVIVALELIEHISPQKIFDFYTSVNILLKKNGIFILSTPLNENLRFTKSNPSGHVRDYQPAVIKMELELSGFKVLETHELYAFKKKYKLKKLLTRVLPGRWKPNNIIVKAGKI